MVRRNEFGKDHGLVHEVIVTGRKVGAEQGFYSALAHDEELFRRLVWDVRVNARYAYDAVAILNLTCRQHLSSPAPGEIIIRYGGWSLAGLRDNRVVREREFMKSERWYDEYQWSTERIRCGIYAIRVFVPESQDKTFDQQKGLLQSGEEVSPVCLVATAITAHRFRTGENLLRGNVTVRCKESRRRGEHVTLGTETGPLSASNIDDDDRSSLLSSARFIEARDVEPLD